MQPEERIRHLLEKGSVLGDRYRLAIMLYLSLKGRARFKEIAEGLGISAGNLAHHLRVLEEKGYIKVDKTWEDMRARIISLTSEGVVSLADFLTALKELS